MAHLSITRFSGDPDQLLATYDRTAQAMSRVGRDHDLIVHAAMSGSASCRMNPSPTSPVSCKAFGPYAAIQTSNEDRDVVESYRLGVNSYIVKPVQFEAFLETVAKIGLYWVLTNRAPA